MQNGRPLAIFAPNSERAKQLHLNNQTLVRILDDFPFIDTFRECMMCRADGGNRTHHAQVSNSEPAPATAFLHHPLPGLEFTRILSGSVFREENSRKIIPGQVGHN